MIWAFMKRKALMTDSIASVFLGQNEEKSKTDLRADTLKFVALLRYDRSQTNFFDARGLNITVFST
jgi:hypothetical protein